MEYLTLVGRFIDGILICAILFLILWAFLYFSILRYFNIDAYDFLCEHESTQEAIFFTEVIRKIRIAAHRGYILLQHAEPGNPETLALQSLLDRCYEETPSSEEGLDGTCEDRVLLLPIRWSAGLNLFAKRDDQARWARFLVGWHLLCLMLYYVAPSATKHIPSVIRSDPSLKPST